MEPGYDKITLSIQTLSTAERSLTMSAKREDIKTVFFGQERANTKILLINTVTQLPAGSGIRPMPEWQSRTCNIWWDTRMQMWHGMSIPMLPMPMQKILQFQTNGKAQKLGWGYTKFTPIGRRTIKRCNGSYTNEILKGETFWFIKRYKRKKTMVKILFICHGKISSELQKHWFYRVFVKMKQEFTTSLLLLKFELFASTR